MKQQVMQVHPAYMGVPLVDYKKGKYDIYAKRYDDPSQYAKEQNEGIHFWMWFHADWYESVIFCKSHPTAEMKTVNWDYLEAIDLLVLWEVEDACMRMFLNHVIQL
jgi:hypothetical protein